MSDSSTGDTDPGDTSNAHGEPSELEPIRLDFTPSRRDYWLGYCEYYAKGWQQLTILLSAGLLGSLLLFPSADNPTIRTVRPWYSVELLTGGAMCLIGLLTLAGFFSYLFVYAGKAAKTFEQFRSTQFWLTDAGLLVTGVEEGSEILHTWKSLNEAFEGSFNFVISGKEAQLVIPKRFLPKSQRSRIRKLLRAKVSRYCTFFSRHFAPSLLVESDLSGRPSMIINLFRQTDDP